MRSSRGGRRAATGTGASAWACAPNACGRARSARDATPATAATIAPPTPPRSPATCSSGRPGCATAAARTATSTTPRSPKGRGRAVRHQGRRVREAAGRAQGRPHRVRQRGRAQRGPEGRADAVRPADPLPARTARPRARLRRREEGHRRRQGLSPSGADVACPPPGWTRSRPPRRRRQPPGKKTSSTGVRNRGKVCLAKADLRFEHGFPPGSAIRQRDPRGASQAERSLTELARAPDALSEDQTIMRSRPRIITGVRPELDRGQTPARPAK